MKRCGQCKDEIGSLLICARIAERLMCLCFLYEKRYAPYSKWFGTAFGQLDIAAPYRLSSPWLGAAHTKYSKVNHAWS